MKIAEWARKKSPWLCILSSGTCNGCEIECLAALTPRYDLERFGIKLVGSPKHADIIAATGSMTKVAKKRIMRVYHQVPKPRVTIAVGTCSCSGGVFYGSEQVEGGVAPMKPKINVPGCPPRPQQIIRGIEKALEKLCSKP